MTMVKRIVPLLKKIQHYITKKLLKFMRLKRRIVLESHPDLSGNTFEFYEFLLKNKVNLNYKIYWLVENPENYKKYAIKNIKFLALKPSNIIKELRKKLLFIRLS